MLQRVLAKYKIQIKVIFFLNQSSSVICQILKDRIYGVTVHVLNPDANDKKSVLFNRFCLLRKLYETVKEMYLIFQL